jgi:hypothetical protein
MIILIPAGHRKNFSLVDFSFFGSTPWIPLKKGCRFSPFFGMFLELIP